MGDLQNDFLWSFSRQMSFDRCKREYYLRVFGGWGGWNWHADDRTKLAYRLGKMTNLDAWAGSIVHRVIAARIWQISDRTNSIDDAAWEDMREGSYLMAVNQLRSGWRESLSNEWETNPKQYLRLFEHHYGVDISRERTDQIKQRILSAIDGWFASDFARRLRAGDFAEILSVEQMRFADIFAVRVCGSIDFVGRTRTGRVEIWDWKTGHERSEHHTQGRLYASMAVRPGADLHGQPLDPLANHLKNVSVWMHYLDTGTTREVAIHDEAMDEMHAWLTTSAMEQLRSGGWPGGEPDEAKFPMTDDRRRCRYCVYHEICHGTRRIEAPIE